MMNQNLRYAFLTFFILLFIYACEQKAKVVTSESVGLSSDTIKVAELRMQQYIDSGKLAGISTVVLKNGITIQRANFGFKDIDNQKPVTDSTIFRIFSMTKPITTVALMMLYDEGKFKLDDPVSMYIPEFGQTMVHQFDGTSHTFVPQEPQMTIRHLLTHTSGLSYGWENTYVDSLLRASNASGWDGVLADKIKILAGIPLNFQPGSQYKYGLSIDVAGYIVEVLSGVPLDEYFQSKIFDPLKMDDTGFYVPEEDHDRLTVVYSKSDSGTLVVNINSFTEIVKKPVTLFSGGGGLVSTMDDYMRFCMMMLNKGELEGVRLLKASTLELIMTDQLPEGTPYNENEGYGLGGAVNYKTGEYSWGGAASTSFTIYPKNEMIIITYAQLMPSDFTYANEFKSIVRRGLLN